MKNSDIIKRMNRKGKYTWKDAADIGSKSPTRIIKNSYFRKIKKSPPTTTDMPRGKKKLVNFNKRVWLSPDIGWRKFKRIQDLVNKMVHEQGPYPMHIDKVLWEMLKARQINIYLDLRQKSDPLIITTKAPRTSAINVLR